MLKGWADGRGASAMSLNIKQLLPWDITLPIRSNFVTRCGEGWSRGARWGAQMVPGEDHRVTSISRPYLHIKRRVLSRTLSTIISVRCGAIDSSYTNPSARRHVGVRDWTPRAALCVGRDSPGGEINGTCPRPEWMINNCSALISCGQWDGWMDGRRDGGMEGSMDEWWYKSTYHNNKPLPLFYLF